MMLAACFLCGCLMSRASEFPREYDGTCLQMRLSYNPSAHIFLFLVQWMDCSLAGALGLLRILIYKVYVDGTTTMSTHERKASIKEFYGREVKIRYSLLSLVGEGCLHLELDRWKACSVRS